MGNEKREFTSEELKNYDGKNGKPAYFAHKGKVYDVSESVQWFDGSHFGEHFVGIDLTEETAFSPHGEEVLKRLKEVGILVS